ncbi:Membrane protein, distant similarity to thiosulphate:quinone oxidoreductase DoxD [[Actinomadura] parvosata subsp. kistnae]|uniref:DoxX family protein n=1 Tax=[Actinomadura] parvosata subsp. kistnae TaxID=1909395 RepID=A0A1U9ZQL2_9ACTN|nr:DoxX family protein [Nonomuraea sp. ATCC 55076]AQZ60229.1 hypothetical protein BKM31_00720 [Nonomuraea sp. ATCC 55076]SPL91285.1 Membrane protein, distant similarity to thiosulphate:quinone oxidoreductase DoxD [Actinomadura parvosata subsp. kistnae]
MDIGLLILRVALGALPAAHGAQKLFGWFGGHGLAGTAGFFDSVGYRPGRRLAAATAAWGWRQHVRQHETGTAPQRSGTDLTHAATR